ncbi:MAG: ATP-binding protein [Bacteroidaceae bacterium]|nr:ATP-binding protein [Bacteroidaceae bacterium]
MTARFEPLAGRTAEIIEALMQSEDMPADESLQFKLRLCIEEVVENIVSYAYTGGNGFLEVATSLDEGVLKLSFKDAGVRFDPLAAEDPDITLSAEDRPIGGLGIFLCKQMMDGMSYSYTDGMNVLVMTKKTV